MSPQEWISLLEQEVEHRINQIEELEEEISDLKGEISLAKLLDGKYTWPDDYVTGLAAKQSNAEGTTDVTTA